MRAHVKASNAVLKILMLASLVLATAAFFQWKKGTPYGERFESPNKKYYVQKFATWSVPVPRMPGQGSDAIDGYIRLYSSDGKLLRERYATFIRDIQPIWAKNEVFLMGIPEMDSHPWILSTTSE